MMKEELLLRGLFYVCRNLPHWVYLSPGPAEKCVGLEESAGNPVGGESSERVPTPLS